MFYLLFYSMCYLMSYFICYSLFFMFIILFDVELTQNERNTIMQTTTNDHKSSPQFPPKNRGNTFGYSSRAAHTARPQLLRTFACSPVMVADCWSIVATENLESKNNGSRQRRKENLKEEIIKHLSRIVQNPSKSF